MVELVDTPDLGSGAAMRVGSSPIRRTKRIGGNPFGLLPILFFYSLGELRYWLSRNFVIPVLGH